MSQLKPSFVSEIQAAIEKSRFTLNDFNLEFPNSGTTLAIITFLYKPEYMLVLTEETKREKVTVEEKFSFGMPSTSRSHSVEEKVFTIRATPGRFKTVTTHEINGLGQLLEELPKWCENIRSDLYVLAPKVDPLATLREELQKKIDSLIDKPDEFFREEELKIVDDRFDQLLAEVVNLKEQYSLTKQQLDSMQKEFEEFKKSARAYPKGLWAKITGNKLIKTAGQIVNSPEGRTFLFQQIRRALGVSDDA
jgi:hypothetical protein